MINLTLFYEIDFYLWEFELLFILFNFFLLLTNLIYKVNNNLLLCLWYTNIFLNIILYLLYPNIIINNPLYLILFWFKILLLFFYSLILLFLIGNKIINISYEIIILLNFAIISLCILLSSQNLITFLLCIEIFSYITYILVASKTSSFLSSESGIKYIIIGALSTAFFLISISMFYFELGTLTLHDLSLIIILKYFTNNLYFYKITLAYIFLSLGLLIKLGSVPFHVWYIDIYQTLDYWFLSIIGTLPKFAIITFFLLFNLHLNIMSFINIKILLIFCAFLNLIIGNLLLLLQVNLKKIILYYSIQSNSLIIIFLILQAEWVYLYIYLIIYILSYLYFTLILSSLYHWSIYTPIINIYTLLSIILINPVISWHLICSLLILGSMPPFLLFFSKIYILISLSKYFFF